MQNQGKGSWILRVWQRIWGRTFWAMLVVVGAVIIANVFGQSWILGPAGVLAWFITYPSLGGRGRPTTSVDFDAKWEAKLASESGKTEKDEVAVRFSSGAQQVSFVLYAVQSVAASLAQQDGVETTSISASFIDDLRTLANCIRLLLVKMDTIAVRSKSEGTDDVVTSPSSKIGQWSAQVDHAVSLVEAIMIQVQAGALDLVEWSAIVKREIAWLEAEVDDSEAVEETIKAEGEAQQE